MEETNCGGEGGWTRVACVDMSQSGTTCPQGLTQRLFTGKNYCGRNIVECQSTVFPTHGLSYSHVCGRLRGYQFGGPDAFNASIVEKYTSVDSNYVDGASISMAAIHVNMFGHTLREYTPIDHCNMNVLVTVAVLIKLLHSLAVTTIVSQE